MRVVDAVDKCSELLIFCRQKAKVVQEARKRGALDV
jgi:hypothetical protein